VTPATFLGATAAGAIAAVVPRDAPAKHRLGLAFAAAATVAFMVGIWPPPVGVEEVAGTEWKPLLSVLLATPILGAFLVLFIPRQGLQTLRYFTYAVMAFTFIASLTLLSGPMTAGWHYQVVKDWIPSLGIRYHVAVDGISLWLILLTTFITPIAIFAALGSIKDRVKELCFAFLLLEGAMIGAFISLDLFLFYTFWEVMLLPMYLMIGIWGGADKIKAAIKFFLYTMTGSVLMLAAMVYLVWSYQKLTGHYTFDFLSLERVVLPTHTAFKLGPLVFTTRSLCFWAFSIAFFVKVPMWPVHTWLPDAHVQAPTGGSVILAAVMLKLGTYAYMRFSLGLFPAEADLYAPNLAGIAILGGIVYAALVAWKQPDFKKLIAYSSVAHLGYVMLGIFGTTPSGMQGAVLHGPLTNPKNKRLPDISSREALAVAPLIILMFTIGFFPAPFLDRIKHSVGSTYRQLDTISHQVKDSSSENETRLLPFSVFPPEMMVGAPDAPPPKPPVDTTTAMADTQKAAAAPAAPQAPAAPTPRAPTPSAAPSASAAASARPGPGGVPPQASAAPMIMQPVRPGGAR
jgi:proton-translocating NADH-quinone oxidoreductase chain M